MSSYDVKIDILDFQKNSECVKINVCILTKLWYNTLEKGVGKKKFPLLLFVGGGHERTN
jgi:hypothetical protein